MYLDSLIVLCTENDYIQDSLVAGVGLNQSFTQNNGGTQHILVPALEPWILN